MLLQRIRLKNALNVLVTTVACVGFSFKVYSFRFWSNVGCNNSKFISLLAGLDAFIGISEDFASENQPQEILVPMIKHELLCDYVTNRHGVGGGGGSLTWPKQVCLAEQGLVVMV